ncbi:MAG: branched-chain amino acid ABC transporter permease [Actinomycetota bacterium]|nr:branched-chain amino acid ABC transporter permease [Actinomycetota bacterium]
MRTGVVIGALVAIVALILWQGAGDDAGPAPYVVIGVASGATYGLIALGLVLVYKGTRVFNFAAGEFGTIAAFIVFVLIEQKLSLGPLKTNGDVPYGAAIAIAVLAVLGLGLLLERVIVRPLLNAPRITLLVATIAFTLLAVGVELLLFLPEAKNLAPAVPTLGADGVPQGPTLFEYIVRPQELVILGVLLGLAVVLAYFFSRTDLGLAVLATSQDAFATRVVGIGVERMSRFIWGAAAFLGAIGGILYIPIAGALAPGVMTSGVLIPSFTAAVIGGMTSLPGAFVGGAIVGLIQALSTWASGHYSLTVDGKVRLLQEIIPGFSDVAVVAVLLIVLLARPQGLLGTEA